MSDLFWIHFARFGNLGYLGVERETGRIGLVLADGDICFVNSTLRQYVSSFLVFSEGLPYDAIPDEENDDPLLEAAERVKNQIRRIDPPATEWNTFWDDVYWAIADGDWDIV
ncbi:MAG: SUKH-4 family immunity protein [Actinomycetaceae bacterium]|nr:SUKH-4 family immunity protein [Actinomycetaceae bacterium]